MVLGQKDQNLVWGRNLFVETWMEWRHVLWWLGIVRSMGSECKSGVVCDLLLLLVDKHFMAEEFILKIFKVDLIYFGVK
jgi:hypothetical protein